MKSNQMVTGKHASNGSVIGGQEPVSHLLDG